MIIQPIIASVDRGSITGGASNTREGWLAILSTYAKPLAPPLFVDRRHGDVAGLLVEGYAFQAVANGSIPLLLGGDHSLTYYAFKGSAQALRTPACLLQLDAHHDAWKTANITNYSFVRALSSQGYSVVQRGVREPLPPDWAPEEFLTQDAVYASIDLDVLDPTIFPEVNFPVQPALEQPMLGVDWIIDTLETETSHRSLVGLDIMEWTPPGGGGELHDLLATILSSLCEVAVNHPQPPRVPLSSG